MCGSGCRRVDDGRDVVLSHRATLKHVGHHEGRVSDRREADSKMPDENGAFVNAHSNLERTGNKDRYCVRNGRHDDGAADQGGHDDGCTGAGRHDDEGRYDDGRHPAATATAAG